MTLYERYKWFHEHSAWTDGKCAVHALAHARAEHRAKELGLEVFYEDEDIEWDGDCPAPAIHVWAAVYTPEDVERSQRYGLMSRKAVPIATLGSIGLESWSDPYVRFIEAELFAEALDVLDAQAEERAIAGAEEMSARATFAGVSP